ncbi:MAG: ABC transporter substrate-binding protein [Bacteroidales bacterium]
MKNSILKHLQKIVGPYYKILIVLIIIVSAILLIDRSGKKHDVQKRHFALIQYNDSPLSDLSKQGILDELKTDGFVEGKDFEISISNAQGDIATLNLLVDAVVNDKPDLVFVTSTPTLQAAAQKIKTIPVVFTVVADPILAGAGKSFEDHLPNVTGISTLADYEGMIRWVKMVLPSAKTIGTLFSPGESNSVKNMTDLKKFAELSNLELITVPVNSSQEISDAALSLASRRPDIICQIVDNLTSTAAATIIKIAREQKIPVFGFVSDQSEKGAVLVVSRDYHQAGADAVKLAKRILDGELPSKIPFEFVSKTNVIINPKAAADFHIVLPETLYQLKNIIITK